MTLFNVFCYDTVLGLLHTGQSHGLSKKRQADQIILPLTPLILTFTRGALYRREISNPYLTYPQLKKHKKNVVKLTIGPNILEI